MKETFWGKLRELWAIRRRCQQIKLQQQQQNRLSRSKEFSGGKQRLSKLSCRKDATFRSAGQSARFSSGT